MLLHKTDCHAAWADIEKNAYLCVGRAAIGSDIVDIQLLLILN